VVRNLPNQQVYQSIRTQIYPSRPRRSTIQTIGFLEEFDFPKSNPRLIQVQQNI
jgi:hypothetical protein